jgi:DDE family transposase
VAAMEELGVEVLEVSADRGYHNGVHVVECEANGITPYVPAPNTSKNKGRGLFTKEEFTYSAERDAYLCPAEQWLDPCTKSVKDGRTLQYYANWEACSGCPMREQCTTAKQGRRIMRTPEEERVATMAQRLEERPELMLERKCAVEHPFGTMKRTWDGGYFLMQGLRNVRGEFSLAVLAYNIRRVLNLLGVECLLEVLRNRKLAPQPLARAA